MSNVHYQWQEEPRSTSQMMAKKGNQLKCAFTETSFKVFFFHLFLHLMFCPFTGRTLDTFNTSWMIEVKHSFASDWHLHVLDQVMQWAQEFWGGPVVWVYV